jgi:hypothetical protein
VAAQCLINKCTGTYIEYAHVTQQGTGDVLRMYECSRKWRHRAHKVDSVGKYIKLTAGRWDTQQVHKACAKCNMTGACDCE